MSLRRRFCRRRITNLELLYRRRGIASWQCWGMLLLLVTKEKPKV